MSERNPDSAPIRLADVFDRWTADEVQKRWDAVLFDEREAFLRYGIRHAPWESTPDYAARILKADGKVSLEGAGIIAAIFRAAYDELATPAEPATRRARG